MLVLTWLRAAAARRPLHLLGAAAGVAVGVALLGSIGIFLAGSRSTTTRRAVASVAVDWQVEGQRGSDNAAALVDAVSRFPGVEAALPVLFADSPGFEAVTGDSTQTTGPGVVVALPPGYAATFPGELRNLAGGAEGVLVAQQTAANLHVGPGDTVQLGRSGLGPATAVVDGVVDLPQADSLFQRVGAPAGAQAQAPPDNVVLLPLARWRDAFDPVVAARPDRVRTQVHARVDHHLPADPAAAFAAVSGRARRLEVALAGAGVVGDNLAAALDAARSDALYAQALFVFLGLPGAVLAALLTSAVVGAARARRRPDQALLRTRGATTRQIVVLASAEAALVGLAGSLAGLVGALAVGRAALGRVGLGPATRATLEWAGAAAALGLGVAACTVALPAWRDARRSAVVAGRRSSTGGTRPARARLSVDLALLAAAAGGYALTRRSGYQLVLAPEGVPTVALDYRAFAGPLLLWPVLGLTAWRLAGLALSRGRRLVRLLVRPVSGSLGATVAAAMSRQRRVLGRATALVVLAFAFAASTSVFNATYRQQAALDARLTNGADVAVTESPGAAVGPGAATQLAQIPRVRSVEPLLHRFAYVGADLQDLYGVRPGTVVAGARLQDAYFAGGSARRLLGRLAAAPDSILVSEETVRDFQLRAGDSLTLRLQDGRTKQLVPVTFRYAGIVREFPTAPRDSFLVANADYVARATGSDAVGSFLVDTGRASPSAVAARVRAALGPGAAVTDIESSQRIVGSSLTAVDLAGLSRAELGFGFVLAAAAGGLVMALGLAERRRTFAIAAALGATRRQVSGFVWGECAFVMAGGLAVGALGGFALSHVLVSALRGVFDPPPATLAVPWRYLAGVAGAAVLAVVGASRATIAAARRADPATFRTP